MSTPIPMPAPYTNPININHHSSHQPPPHHPINPVHHPSNNHHNNEPTSMSPSAISTHSSAFPAPSSTAATSPSSTFHLNHQTTGPMGFGSMVSNNPNATTRILQLSDFSKELKTRDIQLVFAEWEDDRGGFKIKWVDDTSCLIVFADPGVAKRAFLTVLSNPPPSLINPQLQGQKLAKLRAYNGPDVIHILTSVQNRPRSRSTASQSLHSRASSMASINGGLASNGLGRRPSMGALAARNRASISGSSGTRPVPPPANPIVQAQVQELIDHVTTAHTVGGVSSSVNHTNRPLSTNPSHALVENEPASNPSTTTTTTTRNRIDDAGKRFIAAGLGKPLPGLDSFVDGPSAASYSLANLTIEEECTTPTAANSQ